MMKKYLYPNILFLLPLALCLCLGGCKTKSKFISDPFGDYVSDAFFFRAVGQGEDADMQRAKSKALHNAKVDIARSANSVCQMVVLDYLDQIGKNADISLREQFISVSTESVSRSLVNVVTEEVVYNQDKSGLYTCYAKVKVEKSNVFDTFAGRMKEKDDLNASIFKQVIDKVVTQVNDKP
ncbi:MAG: hypothetical protein LBS88_03720 [Tannerellaceae bacterium]|jgi:hypothetical protein|nr:hypothetical protein [Tannerellaceae bacterium]